MSTRPIQLPLLDSFVHDEDTPRTRNESLTRLKAAVRRDLEWLLNTRRTAPDLPEGMDELERSVYWYGLPDFSSVAVTSGPGRSDLLNEIQAAVNRFEPRLLQVKVIAVDEPRIDLPQV